MSTKVTQAPTTWPNEATNIFTWAALAQGETGDLVEFPSYVDRTFQVTGTFGGATVVFEGSNDGSTYFTLSDPQGNQLSLTTAGLKQVEEITRYARPRVIGGDGTTSLAVVLLARRHPR
jgi:hypothetical protein